MRAVLLLAAVACAQRFEDGDDTGAPVDFDALGLADVDANLDRSGCDELDGNELPGAATYFVGTYAVRREGVWEVQEKWLVYANATWSGDGGGDCTVTWTGQADQTAGTGACTTCELGLDVELALDAGATTCPEDLVGPEWTAQEIAYGVELDQDGTTRFVFSSSGDEVGRGYHNDMGMNFLSPKSCRWF